MRNLTLAVPDSTYLGARVWAAERDTTITAVVCYMVQSLPSSNIANAAFPVPTPPPSLLRRTLRTKMPSNKIRATKFNPVNRPPSTEKSAAYKEPKAGLQASQNL